MLAVLPVHILQSQALQKHMGTLTEQHARRVEELEAELKQRGVIVSQLQSQKTDAIRKMDEMSVKVKQVGSRRMQVPDVAVRYSLGLERRARSWHPLGSAFDIWGGIHLLVR